MSRGRLFDSTGEQVAGPHPGKFTCSAHHRIASFEYLYRHKLTTEIIKIDFSSSKYLAIILIFFNQIIAYFLKLAGGERSDEDTSLTKNNESRLRTPKENQEMIHWEKESKEEENKIKKKKKRKRKLLTESKAKRKE